MGGFRRYDDPDWDGRYEYDRCDIYEPPLPEEGEIVFIFTDPMEVWDGFTIDGHDMKYIVEHSALVLCESSTTSVKQPSAFR